MQHAVSLDGLHLSSSYVTIGNFDGVHLGHRTLIENLVKSARKANCPSVAVTFFPHPNVILRGVESPYYITTPSRRYQLLADLGIDYVVTLQFTPEFASSSPDDFIQALGMNFGMKELWVGDDFALGKDREGTIEILEQLGRTYQFSLRIIAQKKNKIGAISSSAIRKLIVDGEIKHANRLLGRNYVLSGVVVHGDGRGKSMEFPTANLHFWKQQVVPMNGIYTTRARMSGRIIPSVTNIGFRPTFFTDLNDIRVEAFLMDFEDDIYGKYIELEFINFLRPEIKFDSIGELIDQMKMDAARARQELNNDEL